VPPPKSSLRVISCGLNSARGTSVIDRTAGASWLLRSQVPTRGMAEIACSPGAPLRGAWIFSLSGGVAPRGLVAPPPATDVQPFRLKIEAASQQSELVNEKADRGCDLLARSQARRRRAAMRPAIPRSAADPGAGTVTRHPRSTPSYQPCPTRVV